MNREAWRSQRSHAKSRGISFLLTFEQWFEIWLASGHWLERGRGRGKYCMSRFGDAGAYEVDNVRIITHEQNLSEGHKGKPKSVEHRLRIAAAMGGNSNTLGYKFNDPDYLKRRNLEHRNGYLARRMSDEQTSP